MILLTDSQMQAFIINGFVTVKADFSPAFHESVRTQAEAIFSTEGNPGNDILPKIPDLADLSTHPAVTGALTSILGPGYAMHPHRHCHLTPPQQPAQRHHQDSYEDDQNVRHHRTRWAMAFYYPQDVTAQMGPTSVLPASQYYTSRTQAERKDEALLCGEAGTVTIVHYDLWHRATTNVSDRNRFMVKFLFCRMAEPTAPSWNCSDPTWRDPAADAATPRLWKSVWNWHTGNDGGNKGRDTENRGAVSAGATDRQDRVRMDLSEADLLENVYRLSSQSETGTAALMATLAEDAESLLDNNLAAPHTNPANSSPVSDSAHRRPQPYPALSMRWLPRNGRCARPPPTSWVTSASRPVMPCPDFSIVFRMNPSGCGATQPRPSATSPRPKQSPGSPAC